MIETFATTFPHNNERPKPTFMIMDRTLQRYPYSIAMRTVGRSMEPTLLDGDIVLVDVSVAARKPTRDDVVTAIIRGKGAICGRYRRTRAGAWVYKDNRDDSSWPRVFLGRTWHDYAITGTVRCIIARPGRDGEPGVMMERPVTPAPGNTQAITSEAITQCGANAAQLFHLTTASLRR